MRTAAAALVRVKDAVLDSRSTIGRNDAGMSNAVEIRHPGRRAAALSSTCLMVALAVVLLVPQASQAAPTLGVEMSRLDTSVYRGDKIVVYDVAIKNATAPTATCAPGAWSGSPAPTFAYQWLRDGVSLGAANGAQTATYTPQNADVDRVLQCQVTAANADGVTLHTALPLFYGAAPETPAPGPLAMVAAARPTVAPSAGSAVAGDSVTCTAPTNWKGNPTWTFQWLADGTAAPGSVTATTATTSTYEVAAADEGKVLQCRALGVNGSGSSVALSPAKATGIPAFPPDNNPSTAPSTTGAEWTNGTTSLAVGPLADGVDFEQYGPVGFGSLGELLSCQMTARICTSTRSLRPQAAFDVRVGIGLYPEAPDMVSTTVTVFGGGAAAPVSATDGFLLGLAKPFALLNFQARAETSAQQDFTQAGGHPFSATSSLDIPTYTTPVYGFLQGNENGNNPVESLRNLFVELPAGFVGNPQTTERICTLVEVTAKTCPATAAIGGIDVDIVIDDFATPAPIYRIYPEEGYAAAFAFQPVDLSAITYVFRARVRSNGDYGVTAISPLPPQAPGIVKVKFATLCGFGVNVAGGVFTGCRQPGTAGSNDVPFLTNPTRCAGDVPVTRALADSAQNPGAFTEEGFPNLSDARWKRTAAEAPRNTDCEALTEAWVGRGPAPTSPSLTFRSETREAAAPAGYTAKLHIPQEGLLTAVGRATAHLKDTTVTLPEGVALNPSAANSDSRARVVPR